MSFLSLKDNCNLSPIDIAMLQSFQKNNFIAFIFSLILCTQSVFTQPSIRLLTQTNTDQVFEYGDSILIEWKSSNPSLPVHIDVSTDSGSTWRPITEVKGTNQFTWIAPEISSQGYQFRVSIHDTSSPWSIIDSFGDGVPSHRELFFMENNRLLSIDGSGRPVDSIRLWDLDNGMQLYTEPVFLDSVRISGSERSNSYAVAIAPDSDFYVTPSGNKRISYIRSFSNNDVITQVNGWINPLQSRRILTDIISQERKTFLNLRSQNHVPWPVVENKLISGAQTMQLGSGFATSVFNYVCYFPLRGIFASYSTIQHQPSRGRIFDDQTGEMIAETSFDLELLDLWYSEDGRLVSLSSSDGMTYFVDATTLQLHTSIQTHSQSQLRQSALSADGKYFLAIYDYGSQASLYRVADAKQIRLDIGLNATQAVTFTPDGMHAVTGDFDGSLNLSRVSDGTHAHEMPKAHTGQINSIVFSKDRTMAATAGGDGKIYLWSTSMAVDQSKYNFTIQSPLPDRVPIRFERVPVQSTSDTIAVGLINRSTSDIFIESYILHGPAASDFKVLDQPSSFFLKPGSTHSIHVAFTPSTNAFRQAWIEFAVSGSYIPAVVYLLGNERTSSVEFVEGTAKTDILETRLSEDALYLSNMMDREFLADVIVYDMIGRRIFQENITLAVGLNRWDLNRELLRGNPFAILVRSFDPYLTKVIRIR